MLDTFENHLEYFYCDLESGKITTHFQVIYKLGAVVEWEKLAVVVGGGILAVMEVKLDFRFQAGETPTKFTSKSLSRPGGQTVERTNRPIFWKPANLWFRPNPPWPFLLIRPILPLLTGPLPNLLFACTCKCR